MAEVTTPPETTIEQQQRDAERDARFRQMHDDAEAKAAERRARGESPTIADVLAKRGAAIVATAPTPAPRDQIVREPAPPPRWTPTEEYVAAIVPKRFRGVTFESYRPETSSQRIAHKAVRQWLDAIDAGKPAMLALVGSQGTGKSHLLYAAANALIERGRRVYARPWYRLADELRYGGRSPFQAKTALEPHEVREQLWSQPVVLLDEVRATASTALDENELAKFSCHAYDGDLPVLITTNVHPLADVMGAPAASRYTHVVIEGPDWRQR